MINNVVLVGRTTKDLELKYTTTGIACCQFDLAVNRPYKNEQGANEADFFKIVAWRNVAETSAKFVKKGMQIGVTGRIENRSYVANDGTKRYVTEIIASGVQFLESKKQQAPDPTPPFTGGNHFNSHNNNYSAGADYGNGNSLTQSVTFTPPSSGININDDDLPF